MKITINLNGIEVELLAPFHAYSRYTGRLDLDGTQEELSFRVMNILETPAVSDLILDLHKGTQAVIWDDAQKLILVVIWAGYDAICVKTILETTGRDYVYAEPSDACIYISREGEVKTESVICGGQFRPKRKRT